MRNFLIVKVSPNLNRRQTEFHCASRMPGISAWCPQKTRKKAATEYVTAFKDVGHPGIPVKRHETESGLYVIEYNDVMNKIRFIRF